jgi:hypothetical protein
MNKQTKDFDAVEMMREVRDRISRETRSMSFEEQRSYFREHAERTRSKLAPAEKSAAV